MIPSLILRKILAAHLKGVPEAEQEKLFRAFEKNPEFFHSLAEEIKKRVDRGEDKMAATLAVMRDKQDTLRGLINYEQT